MSIVLLVPSISVQKNEFLNLGNELYYSFTTKEAIKVLTIDNGIVIRRALRNQADCDSCEQH